MVKKIQAILYYIYRATSSSSNILSRRITQFGLLVLLIIPFATVVFLTYYKLATLYLLSLLFSLFAFSVVAVCLRSAKIKFTRVLPSVVSAGQEMTYTVTCENLNSKQLSSALIHDLPVDPRPTRSEFLLSREPEEHLRNVFDRLFAYYRWIWLSKKKTKFESDARLLDHIKPKQKLELSLKCIPTQRGRLDFNNTKLYLPDPLYLVQKCIDVSFSKDSVLVLPKRYILPQLITDGSARDRVGGLSHSCMAGVSDDFRGLRSYRPGDSPKSIDWAAWARTGKPIVREYENVFFPRYGLVLDTNGSYESVNRFEEAISIAASFASVVDAQECLLELMFLNKGTHTLTIGKGMARSEDLLEHLASLEIELKPDWQDLSRQVARHSASFSVCIVIFIRLTSEREELLSDWRKAGFNLMIIILVTDEEEKKQVLRLGGVPIRINFIQQDLLNLL